MKKPKFALIHGIINVFLSVFIVLPRSGIFGAVENPWKFFWLGILMAIFPLVSSLAGIIIASIQLKKAPASTIWVGLFLSLLGLILHIVFRFVLKI